MNRFKKYISLLLICVLVFTNSLVSFAQNESTDVHSNSAEESSEKEDGDRKEPIVSPDVNQKEPSEDHDKEQQEPITSPDNNQNKPIESPNGYPNGSVESTDENHYEEIKDPDDVLTKPAPTPTNDLNVPIESPAVDKNILSNDKIEAQQEEIFKENKKDDLNNTLDQIKQVENPKGTICLDNPRQGQKVGVTTVVSGWEMSTVENTIIQIWIDNIFVTDKVNRYAREDVMNSVEGFGGAGSNPKPGFSAEIDLSQIPDGPHALTVSLYSSRAEFITSYSQDIQVKNFDGQVCIDTPVLGQKVSTDLTINGWEMSTSEETILQVWIDDKFLSEEVKRYKRNDVLQQITGYGGEKYNKSPGFSTTVSLAGFEEGIHSLTVSLYSSTGVFITNQSVPINIVKSAGEVVIDSPTVRQTVGSKINISGWEMSTSRETILQVWVDNVFVTDKLRRVKRPDVLAAKTQYGGTEVNPTPGFQVEIDTDKFSEGLHTLTISLYDAKGNYITNNSVPILINNYDGTICIDTPREGQEVNQDLIITGWEMSSTKNTLIQVWIDDKFMTDNVHRSARPDVLQNVKGYGGSNVNPTPGFSTSISLANISDGKHSLTVSLYADNGKLITSRTHNISIKKYVGRLCIDSPKENLGVDRQLTVSGWVMSTAPGTIIQVWLDGKFISDQVLRSKREDVYGAISGFGGKDNNPTPGFSLELDLSNYSEGIHSISVSVYSSKGDLMCNDSKKFYIKGQYAGIDVSHYQGNIDWGDVKNSGIEFAMIRAAYRGYSTGNIVTDSYFVKNALGAQSVGMPYGLYFFSQAINVGEAIEEADYVLDLVRSYGLNVTYPIAIDSERVNGSARADNLSRAERTAVVKAFCDRIKANGYTPIIYANKSWFYNNLYTDSLTQYDLWLAHYTSQTDFRYQHAIWQYTSSGSVPGINGRVDMNICYKRYK